MSAITDGVRRRLWMRRGFALPLAILALALVTAAIAASSAATRAEIVANQAVRAQDRAYQLAEAGLQQFIARRSEAGFCAHCVVNPETQQYQTDTTEWTRVSLTGGYADVVTTRLRPKVLNDSVAIFFVRSRGVDTTVKMSGAGLAVYAERTIGQYATFKTASIKPVAALVSITGMTKNSPNSVIDGTDECQFNWATACSSCPFGFQAAIPGLAVPSGATEWVSNGFGNVSSVSNASSANTLKSLLGIDWDAIINNYAIPPDDTVPPNSNWPSGIWKVTRAKGPSYTIPVDGKGILIVEGDLTLTGGRDFDGIVLVGGKITGSGSQASSGLTLTGLNYLLPGAGTPPASSADNSTISSTKTFRYNSCNIATAMNLLTTYYAWSNTWLDNVAVW